MSDSEPCAQSGDVDLATADARDVAADDRERLADDRDESADDRAGLAIFVILWRISVSMS